MIKDLCIFNTNKYKYSPGRLAQTEECLLSNPAIQGRIYKEEIFFRVEACSFSGNLFFKFATSISSINNLVEFQGRLEKKWIFTLNWVKRVLLPEWIGPSYSSKANLIIQTCKLWRHHLSSLNLWWSSCDGITTDNRPRNEETIS